MVDASLPISSDLRLGVLFLDLNSYFASCEQQENPELRGKPVIVAPVAGDNTVAIAASYEAKKYGIKTGTKVGEAKERCADLIITPARPPLYVHMHNKVIEAAETVLPVDKVCSIDEMRFRLIGKERQPEEAMKLARQIKEAIYREAGECMTCSVGIAPNSFLAKLGTEMQKPDGLVVLESKDLPSKIVNLKLTDFSGINKRMLARLNAGGIFSIMDLYKATPQELRSTFGSVTGERWWYLIRGHDMDLADSERKSLSHSNVLHPDLRTDDGCREVLLRLIQKASARLRANGLCASAMDIGVSGFKRSWKDHVRLSPTNDTMTFNEQFLRMWQGRDFDKPLKVYIGFTDLVDEHKVTPSLFDFSIARSELNKAVDEVNQKFGKNTIFLAGMEHAKDSASEKIAFNKTWLFSEGKGDNEWVDTFRGVERPKDEEGSEGSEG